MEIDKRIKLEVLITEREAMVASNDRSKSNGSFIEQSYQKFMRLADKMTELLNETDVEPDFDVEPPEFDNVKDA